jgi:hypothetical protein
MPVGIRMAAVASGSYLSDEMVRAEELIQLLWYLREQSFGCE